MKMTLSAGLPALCLALIATLTAPMHAAPAGDGPRDGDGQRHRIGQALFQNLDLSEEQQQQVKQICEDQKDERVALRQKVRDARQAGDREAMKTAHEALRTHMQAMHAQIRAILTEAQQQQFDQNLQTIKEDRPHRGERQRHRQGGEAQD